MQSPADVDTHPYSWKQCQEFGRRMALAFHESGCNRILAVARGGLVTTSLMLPYLQSSPTIDVIWLQSYDNNHQRGKLTVKGDSPLARIRPWDKVAIVDDIYDSGATMKYLTGIFYGTSFYRMVAVLKQSTAERAADAVDFFCDKIHPDVWVKFPWEID